MSVAPGTTSRLNAREALLQAAALLLEIARESEAGGAALPGGAGAGASRLTARQREVARLAAGGCTARQIAEALAIGRRTVETHLGNAYAKLGVASKLELVQRASELDL